MIPAGNHEALDPVAKADQLVVLLEGIHASAVEALRRSGYTRIVTHSKSLADSELRAALAEASVLGIRSRTHRTELVLQHAKQLEAIGCFCIGTNQVDLKAAMRLGMVCVSQPSASLMR